MNITNFATLLAYIWIIYLSWEGLEPVNSKFLRSPFRFKKKCRDFVDFPDWLITNQSSVMICFFFGYEFSIFDFLFLFFSHLLTATNFSILTLHWECECVKKIRQKMARALSRVCMSIRKAQSCIFTSFCLVLGKKTHVISLWKKIPW